MIENAKINISITGKHVGFKCILPIDIITALGITATSNTVSLVYNESTYNLEVRKSNKIIFKNLTATEKALQIKKFESIFKEYSSDKASLIKEMEKYFNVSYRTIYRYLQEPIDDKELENIELIEKQEKLRRNIDIFFTLLNGQLTPFLTIPTKLGIWLLEGLSYESLHIKTAYDLYKRNFSVPVILNMDESKKVLYIKKDII